MLDYIGLFFNCLCGSAFEDHDYVQPRFADEVKNLLDRAKGRDISYFIQLKKTVDEYRLLYSQPSLDSLGLTKAVKEDFTLFQELYLLRSHRYSETKRIDELCSKAFSLKIPKMILEQIIGDKIDLDRLDPKTADAEYNSYVKLHGNDCMICQDTFCVPDFLKKAIYRTPAGHFMHTKCFEKWGKNCPDCRLEFDQGANNRVWKNSLRKMDKRVQAHFKTVKDPVNTEIENVLPKGPSDAEIARQLYEADVRELQDKLNQENEDARIAYNLENLD